MREEMHRRAVHYVYRDRKPKKHRKKWRKIADGKDIKMI